MFEKTSERITKQWIMAVRRGWLSVLNPTILEWQDVIAAAHRLETFVKNLREQVYFVHRGPSTGWESGPIRDKIEQEFKDVLKTLEEFRRTAIYWSEAANGNYDHMDVTARERGQQMLEIYKKDFKNTLGRWQEKTNKSKSNPYRNPKRIEGEKLLDKILKLLYDDVRERDAVSETNKLYGIPDEMFTDKTIYKEFDLYGMKVIVNDSNLTAENVGLYIKLLDQTYARLKAKGLQFLWYGTVYIECKECGGVNPYGANLGVGGHFNISKDHVKIFSRPSQYIVELMAHELAHRYWFKKMTSAQRLHFADLFLNGSVPAVSEYGKNSADEAFAEVVAFIVVGKEITRDQIDSLKAILGKGSKRFARPMKTLERIASRFLANVYDEHSDYDEPSEDTTDPLRKFRNDWIALTNRTVKAKKRFSEKLRLLANTLPDENQKNDLLALIANGSGESFRKITTTWTYKYSFEEPFAALWKGRRAEIMRTIAWLRSRENKKTDRNKIRLSVYRIVDLLNVYGFEWGPVVGLPSTPDHINYLFMKMDSQLRDENRVQNQVYNTLLWDIGRENVGFFTSYDKMKILSQISRDLENTEKIIEPVLKACAAEFKILDAPRNTIRKFRKEEETIENSVRDEVKKLQLEFVKWLTINYIDRTYNTSKLYTVLREWEKVTGNVIWNFGIMKPGSMEMLGGISNFFYSEENAIKEAIAESFLDPKNPT